MPSENNKRIAKNTLMLYIRMLFTMGVSLYTSRVVLATLGVEDFGIYGVVGGVVAMFSIISGSLSAAISRFITFELGKKEDKKLNEIFFTSMTIQGILALIIFILAETIGVWFLNAKMNISEERMIAANWVLQISILTFIINLINIPYSAFIIAYEHMKTFAYISIIEVMLKLTIVYVLMILPFDKLILYAILLLLVTISIRIIYGIYCKKHFEECTYHFILDKPLLKQMMTFGGWNFIGASSGVLKDQGVNIVLNLFCGTAVNAARGLAVNVNSAVSGFVSSFMTALNPQITKSYAANNHQYMMQLVQQGNRFSFYLLLLFSLPILIDTEYILSVWLKLVPEHAVNFVRLILILAMSESLSGTLITAMLAHGKIRKYQIVVGGIQMMNLPISYFFLKMGGFPEGTMLIAIFISQICLFVRLLLLRSMIGISAKYYIQYVYLNVILVAILSAILPYIFVKNMDQGIIRLLSVCFVSVLSTLLVIMFIGCTKDERKFALNQTMSIINNKKR
ncbi:MAG: oligosaccharide flippase family protein [Candidatus Azobacteroides sp.]|nr:oligosaccharide flippase family protein [Candidatus Azobacteroides sp.]